MVCRVTVSLDADRALVALLARSFVRERPSAHGRLGCQPAAELLLEGCESDAGLLIPLSCRLQAQSRLREADEQRTHERRRAQLRKGHSCYAS